MTGALAAVAIFAACGEAGTNPPTPDAGAPASDAGTGPAPDAGTPATDGGTPAAAFTPGLQYNGAIAFETMSP
ncbi:MAG: hypothetical protein FJ086_07265 [Deltaproteobacteria bacterium]|nr:hypothetical protein [Deltaproteobacteria bacterium]